MAKQKGPHSVQNRHIYARASYLYQVAHYLASQRPQEAPTSESVVQSSHEIHPSDKTKEDRTKNGAHNLSRQMLTDMRVVTQKILIRQSPDLKRTICKFCDTLQIEGQTSSSVIENASRGGRKPWADLLVVECRTCGHVRRFPVSAPKQKRKPLRLAAVREIGEPTEAMKDSVT